jgi:hypothetical protein
MKTEPRYPELVALKLSPELAAEIRRKAREDDRTVSGYLRRLLASVLQPSTSQNAELK